MQTVLKEVWFSVFFFFYLPSHNFSAEEIAVWFETTFFALVSLFCAPHLFREPSVVHLSTK